MLQIHRKLNEDLSGITAVKREYRKLLTAIALIIVSTVQNYTAAGPRVEGARSVSRIRLLRGERNREFVLSHRLEPTYLKACPQPLRDVAILILETGVRPGEAVNLPWTDVYLQPAVRAKFGYIAIRGGKSRYAKRNLSLTASGRRC